MPWRANDYEELINRDKASLDIFWLRDESLNESDNLPCLDVLPQEILEDFEAALELFREIPIGADAVFVEAPESKEEMKEIARQVPGPPTGFGRRGNERNYRCSGQIR